MGQEEAFSRKPAEKGAEMDVRLGGHWIQPHVPVLTGAVQRAHVLIPHHLPLKAGVRLDLFQILQMQNIMLLKRNIWKWMFDCNFQLS